MTIFVRTFLFFTCAALWASAGSDHALGQEESDIKVEPRGLRIIQQGYGEDRSSGVSPFNRPPGTTIALLLYRQAGNIIEFDRDASTLDNFTDDLGTNLLEKGENKWSRSGFSHVAKISDDGKAAMVEVSAASVPAGGAKYLQTAGTLNVVTARGQKSVEAGKVTFEEGETFNVRGAEISVVSAKPSQRDDGTFKVTFQTTDNVDAIAGLKFARDGDSVKARRTLTRRWGMGGNTVTIQWRYSFERVIEAGNIAADVWVDLQTHDVPFDVEVDLGLSSEDEKTN